MCCSNSCRPPTVLPWLFPWRWETNLAASKTLGIPVAQSLSVELIEEEVVSKLDNRITKLKARHLTLAARVVTANSLLLGSIWYMLTVWAGEKGFLRMLQKKLDDFVWAGRARVRRSATALPKAEGGLNLLDVESQLRALAGKFMIWLLGDGPHILRSILSSHIMKASWKRWGLRDLSWLVSKCGSISIEGWRRGVIYARAGLF